MTWIQGYRFRIYSLRRLLASGGGLLFGLQDLDSRGANEARLPITQHQETRFCKPTKTYDKDLCEAKTHDKYRMYMFALVWK